MNVGVHEITSLARDISVWVGVAFGVYKLLKRGVKYFLEQQGLSVRVTELDHRLKAIVKLNNLEVPDEG